MKRPQDWSPEEKLAAVIEAASLTDADLGAFLRNKGLHEAHLQQWREQMLTGLKSIPVLNKKKASESKSIRELEKDLRRKEKALAETAALLVLKKSPGNLRGRGRRHGQAERQQVLTLIDAAISQGETSSRNLRACCPHDTAMEAAKG